VWYVIWAIPSSSFQHSIQIFIKTFEISATSADLVFFVICSPWSWKNVKIQKEDYRQWLSRSFFEAFLLHGYLPQPFINQKPEYKLCTERDELFYNMVLSHDDKLSARELFTLCFSMVISKTNPTCQPLKENLLCSKIQLFLCFQYSTKLELPLQ
jgi:hypothetical protein